jgi:hypothetical protein
MRRNPHESLARINSGRNPSLFAVDQPKGELCGVALGRLLSKEVEVVTKVPRIDVALPYVRSNLASAKQYDAVGHEYPADMGECFGRASRLSEKQ